MEGSPPLDAGLRSRFDAPGADSVEPAPPLPGVATLLASSGESSRRRWWWKMASRTKDEEESFLDWDGKPTLFEDEDEDGEEELLDEEEDDEL